MAARSRPKSAYAVCCGASARAAGVPGAYGGRELGSVSVGIKPNPTLLMHALRQESPYAEVAPPGWRPLEPPVKPLWNHHGAGVISQGSIDNTYLPFPLQNAWGKSREMAQRETRKPPHKQCTDLLVVAKGYKWPAPPVTQMASVLTPYQPTVPLVHPIDAQRIETGFIRTPNTFPGAKPPAKSPLVGAPPPANPAAVPNAFDRKKLYENPWLSTSVIPVKKTVTDLKKRPSTAQPHFLRKFAGLPGGLGLTDA